MNREIDLCVSAYGVTRNLHYDLAILPWGATEPHNLHLPYLTDSILSHDVAVDAAQKVMEEEGIRCMVLPPVNMGAQNPGQRDLPFCMHFRQETQKAILTDIVANLHHQGIRKLLIINGHGGNLFKGMIRDLSVDYPDFIIASSEWFKMAPVKEYFDNPGDHADEIETSVMMYYHPELVRLEEAGEGRAKGFSIPALAEGKVWIPRHWTLVTTDTGIGNPSASTAEKGERFVHAVVKAYADFLKDITNIQKQTDFYK